MDRVSEAFPGARKGYPVTADDHIDADLVVIGFGKGGKTLASTLGRQGWRVVMVEQSAQMYGGTCINIGCVPTKSLVYQSEHPAAGGYPAAVANTGALTTQLRAENFAMLDDIDTVTVLTGPARFLDSKTIEVHTAERTVSVGGRYFVVGTGSVPQLPDLPGLRASDRTVTSTEMLSTAELPDRLVVLGGGYVGLEFAAMYAGYGSQVTVLERHARILGREDSDIATVARDILTADGVTVITEAQVTGIEDHDAATAVNYEADGVAHSVEADLVLVALGRTPVTAELALDKAGVTTAADGSIVVDEYLRTSQPHIFAVGDVNGGPQFTYISLDDYRIVLDQLAGEGSRSVQQRQAVPYVLFITPPLARVGLTEREARSAGIDIKVATLPVAKMATVPRARIVGESRGIMKVIVAADTDQILGAGLLSYDSHEVINTVALAMRHGITASAMRDAIYTHPSMTEAFNQLLGALR